MYDDVIDIFVISFCFQRGIHAVLELPSELPIAKVLKSKVHCTYKEKIIPPGVATRDAWGPILLKYCRVQYNETSKKLEVVKRKFVGIQGGTLKYDDDDDDDDDDDAGIPIDRDADGNDLPGTSEL